MKAVDTHYWKLLSSHLLQIKRGFKLLTLALMARDRPWLTGAASATDARAFRSPHLRKTRSQWLTGLAWQDNFRHDAVLAPERPLGLDGLSRHHVCLTSLALPSFPKPLTGLFRELFLNESRVLLQGNPT